MKKMIMTLAIALVTFSAFAGSALSPAGEETVAPQVLNAFKNEFSTAKEVSWTATKEYYKASFTWNEKHVFAFYNPEGELLGLTRYISPVDLPLALLSSLKKNYSEYWISDLFEMAKNDGTTYYVTVEDADNKIVLKATGNTWNVHRRTKKA